MANLEEIMSQKAEAFQGEDFKAYHSKLSEKLTALGYEVLINQKDKAEFVPASRLHDAVSQRDTFRTQTDQLNQQLAEMKAKTEDPESKLKLQSMIDENQKLLVQLEETKKRTEIISEASGAIDPRDVVVFVDMTKIKITAKGEVVGAKEEVDRIRKEKPHLFGKAGGSKGGADNSGDSASGQGLGMNASIRQAAGRRQQIN